MWTSSVDENKTGVQSSGGGGEPPSPTKSSSSLTTTRTLSHSSSTSIKSQTSLVRKSPSEDKNVGMRGRLRDEDIQRLEEKAAWVTKELDFFADMGPVIASSHSSLMSVGSQKTRDITEESTTATSLSLQYQPGEVRNWLCCVYWLYMYHLSPHRRQKVRGGAKMAGMNSELK